MAKKLKDFKPKMCSDCGKTPCACMSEARLDEGRPSQRHPLEGEVEQVDEKASDKEVKMATGIPHDKRYVGGNMTGAISAIEKIRKNLSKHPRVAASLKAANEEVEGINEKLETETIKHPKGERPKGIGWVLKSAGEQTGKDHSVWERKFKRVGGVKEEVQAKAFKSGQSEINRLKRMGEEVEMFEAVDPVEARDILKKHGGADEDFHALPSEHKNSLHHLAYKFKHNPGKGASGSRARMFHAHLKRQAAKADKAQADVQKLTKEEHDYEYEMARNQLTTASRSIERLMGMLKGEGNLEAWVQSKLTLAADYLDTVADYMESDKKPK